MWLACPIVATRRSHHHLEWLVVEARLVVEERLVVCEKLLVAEQLDIVAQLVVEKRLGIVDELLPLDLVQIDLERDGMVRRAVEH